MKAVFPWIHAAGGFFWFVFLSAQENEQGTMGMVNPGLFPGYPSKCISAKTPYHGVKFFLRR
jgi:hypothetical protein